jgi:biotin synthase-like enzyme
MKLEQLRARYRQPLFDLISQSRQIHLEHWRGEEVQRCSLLSVKTGGLKVSTMKVLLGCLMCLVLAMAT